MTQSEPVHEFSIYPNPRYGKSCIKCGRIKDHPIHNITNLQPEKRTDILTVNCQNCRLVWLEDRLPGDSPISHHVFLCPRCGKLGKSLFSEETEEK